MVDLTPRFVERVERPYAAEERGVGRRSGGLRCRDDLLEAPPRLGRGVTVGREDERHPGADELPQQRGLRVFLARRLAKACARDLYRHPRRADRFDRGLLGRRTLGRAAIPELLRQVEVRHHVVGPGGCRLRHEPVVLVPEVRRPFALVARGGAGGVDPAPRHDVDRPQDDVPRVRREELAETLLVSLRVVRLDPEEDVDPSAELLAQREHLLDVPGQLGPRHRETGLGVLAGEEPERHVVGERDLVEPPRDCPNDVISGRAARVPAPGGVDVVIRRAHRGGG